VTLGALIALRQTGELKNHVRAAINNGLTVKELEEALIQTTPYVGFPAVASATTAFVEVLQERGIDASAKSPEERGLL
jgi:4-carboxymuconolactone decarboxylase